MSEQPAVLTERRDSVLIITINRPEVRNAVNGAVSAGIGAALEDLDADDALAVGVLTGAGGFFSAGMDLGAFVRGEEIHHPERGFAGIIRRAARKPLIAAVEGFAVAGGFEIALACDLIVAAEGAKLGIPEVKRGLVAGGGGLLRLPERIPYSIAMELALTGDILPAERAHDLGLVNALTEPGAALDGAIELAERIAANGPLAVATTKRIIIESKKWTPDTMFAEQGKLMAPVFSSNDAKEGAIAFAEKRAPNWTGT